MKVFSEESRGKISETLKRKGIRPPSRFGSKHSETAKKRMQVSAKNRPPISEKTRRKLQEATRGESHPMWGRHHSEETRGKIKEARKKQNGENHPRWQGGFPKCSDCGKKLSSYKSTHCQSCMFKGARNFNWKGGITSTRNKIYQSPEYQLWRDGVFVRDGYTCQKYETRGVKLHAHHIRNFSQFPELRFVIDCFIKTFLIVFCHIVIIGG